VANMPRLLCVPVTAGDEPSTADRWPPRAAVLGQARVTPESIRPSGTVGRETGGTNLYGPGVVAQDFVEAVGAHKDARTSPGIVDHHMALVTLEAPISTTQCAVSGRTPSIEQPIGPRLPSWFALVRASSPAAPGQSPPPLTIQSGLGHQVSVVTQQRAVERARGGSFCGPVCWISPSLKDHHS
jgi:hypothetical protein